MGVKFSELADSPVNNLRIVRLVAAAAVIFSHAYIVNLGMARGSTQEPFGVLTGVGSGELAVDAFFIISGFLVSRSLLRSGNLLDYAASRMLRIYPGLIVAILLFAFVLGPAVTSLPLGTYLRSKDVYEFVVRDSAMFGPLGELFGLPGVFSTNPYPDVVSGSIWTLPWEVWMYITLFGMFVLRLLGRLYPVVLLTILATYFALKLGWWTSTGVGPPIWSRFLAFFHVGVAGYLYRSRIPVSLTWLAVISGIAILVNAMVYLPALLLPLWLGYALVIIGYDRRFVIERWCAGPDYSYGVYIYGYAVQQLIVHALGPMGAVVHTALALGLTMPLAIASWHLVEKPALTLKARVRAWHHRRMARR